METIVPIASVQNRARADVLKHATPDACCPWPPMSDAAHAYRAYFRAEQAAMVLRITTEAKEAAQHYESVNAACPYPFHTPAGTAYRAAFLRAKSALHFAIEEVTA